MSGTAESRAARSRNGGRDVNSMKTLLHRPNSTVSVVATRAFGMFGVLKDLFHKIGPDPPTDMDAKPVPSGLPDKSAEAVLFSYDEGHAGRYSIPAVAAEGASLDFDHVVAQPEPQAYVRANLSFPAPGATAVAAGTEDDDDKEEPLVVFSPGLNTVHQPAPGETTTPQRLAHYCRVLQTVPMAQLHTGTQMDQPDVVVDASGAPLLRGVLAVFGRFLPAGIRPTVDGATLTWDNRDIDGMQAALSLVNATDTALKARFRALLDGTRAPRARALTLVVYSRASMEMCAALHQHYGEGRGRGESNGQIFDRLRRLVTVVTVGASCKGFADGPAYVHVSAWADPLASTMGVNGRKTFGAGRDAVFVNCDSPFNESAFDNHNFGAITAQWLSIVLRANGVLGLHALWKKGQEGELKGVENALDVLSALIVLTGGLEWLWNREDALKDVPAERFPDRETAKAEVKRALGEEYLNIVLAAFPGQ